MGKQIWKPGNMLYPLPAVLVSVAGKDGKQNLFTVAWTGTICSDPPMVSISVRPERYSYEMICETGEFVINLTTEELAFATDYCGVKSGRNTDKWKEMNLTSVSGKEVKAPLVKESPVNIDCRVTEKKELGTHHMFLAEVVAVHAQEAYLDENGRFDLAKAKVSQRPTTHNIPTSKISKNSKTPSKSSSAVPSDTETLSKIPGSLYTSVSLPIAKEIIPRTTDRVKSMVAIRKSAEDKDFFTQAFVFSSTEGTYSGVSDWRFGTTIGSTVRTTITGSAIGSTLG